VVVLALLACRAEIAGNVVDEGGAPVVGARLVAAGAAAEPCEAVTDAEGLFRTRCARGAHVFTVTHPDHLPGTWNVDGDAREVAAGALTLVAIPAASGAWLSDGVRFQTLRGAHLHRVATERSQDWCLPADASPVVVGPGARLLRNEPPAGVVPADAERWRLYRVTEARVDAPAVQAAGASTPVTQGTPTSSGTVVVPSRTPTAVEAAASPSVPVPPPAPASSTNASPLATTLGRCAYRLRKGTAEHWEFTAERVPLDGEGAARLWTDLGSLPAGDYVLAPWVAGMFVREDVTADTWRGTWIRVPVTP
jgi:hypothetical protein